MSQLVLNAAAVLPAAALSSPERKTDGMLKVLTTAMLMPGSAH